MTWIKTMFGTEKAIIGLLHLKALPGDPFYEGDMKKVIKKVLLLYTERLKKGL